MNVTADMLSPYSIDLLEKLKMKPGNISKLVPNLYNKQKYVVHYRNLKLYLNCGLKLTRIHRILQFNQSPWMRSYINFNTEMRKKATNSFEKDFFKLANNSVFGRTMINVRKHRRVVLITTPRKLRRWAAKPSFKNPFD